MKNGSRKGVITRSRDDLQDPMLINDEEMQSINLMMNKNASKLRKTTKVTTERKFSPKPARDVDDGLTSFVNTTPRHRNGPTVTSFHQTSLENTCHKFNKKMLFDDKLSDSSLNGSAFLSEDSDSNQAVKPNFAGKSKDTSVSLKIGMVNL